MVAGLGVAPEVMRHWVSLGGWHAALQPYPWLTAAVLTLAALYALLAEGTAVATARNAVCAVTGFVLAPAAGSVTALTAPTQSTAEAGGAVLAAALCGAGLAAALRGAGLAAALRGAGLALLPKRRIPGR